MIKERLQKAEKMIDFVQNDQKITVSEYKKLVKKQGHIKHKPVWVDGIKFANNNEADIYWEFKMMPTWDIIKCHPMFYVTIPFTRGDQKFAPIRYTADFLVKDKRSNFIWVIEVKSDFTVLGICPNRSLLKSVSSSRPSPSINIFHHPATRLLSKNKSDPHLH